MQTNCRPRRNHLRLALRNANARAKRIVPSTYTPISIYHIALKLLSHEIKSIMANNPRKTVRESPRERFIR